MSTLIVDELYPGVVFAQDFTVTDEMDCAFIRPWVYLHNTLQDGQLECRVKDGAEVLKTVTVDYTEINAAKTDAYAHGFLRVTLHPLMLKIPSGSTEKTYTMEFEMVNHTLDTGNFLGMVRSWEDPLYPEDPAALNDTTRGLGFELYEFKEL